MLETDSENKIILYVCEQFPYVWKQKKVLLHLDTPSDIVVYQRGNDVFILVSQLKGSASRAQNILYLLDSDNLELQYLVTQNECGEKGFRNAGLFFEENGKLYRPGQNCENNSYGKSLYFWENIELSHKGYSEKFAKEVTIEDIYTPSGNFTGIHTYNRDGKFEVVDLKIEIRNTFLKRIHLFFEFCRGYISQKTKFRDGNK